MIEMFVNGRQLLLPENISVRIEMNHPAFETDCIPLGIVYNFDLPVRYNESIFDYANYVEVAGKYREYDWRMSYGGIHLLCGKLILQRVSDVFRCAASIKQLPSNFTDKNITDFSFPKIEFHDMTMSQFIDSVRSGFGQEIAFPKIYAPLLYGDGESSANPAWGNIINEETPVENTIANHNTVIPLFYFKYILQTILKSENYTFDFSRMDNFIDELLLFNNYTLDAFPVDYYVFSNQEGQDSIFLTPTVDKYGCISQNGLYNVKEPGEYEINIVLRGKFRTNIYPDKPRTNITVEIIYTDEQHPNGVGLSKVIATNRIDYNPFYPDTQFEFANLTYTHRSTQGVPKQFRFRITALIPGTDTNAHRLLTFTFGYVEIKRIQGSGVSEDEPDKNYYTREIIPVNHLPEISVADLLLGLKQIFGIIWLLDNNTANIQAILSKDLLKSRTMDLTRQYIDNSVEIDIIEPTSYILKYDLDETKIAGYDAAGIYIKLSDAPKPKREKLLIRVENLNCYFESKIVDGQFKWIRLGHTYAPFQTHPFPKKETIDIKAHPIGITQEGVTVYPYFDEQGVSPMFLPGTTKIDKLILLLRTGPFGATTTNITAGGVTDTGRIAFNFNGEAGLYNMLLKEWYDFISMAHEYTYEFLVTIEDMLRILELFKPQDFPVADQVRRVRIGNQVYVPKQFSFELTNAGIKCQAKLMK